MSLTLIFIGITVLVSFYSWSNGNAYFGMMMNPYEIFKQKQYWRLITSGFIHSGYMHLGFNMFTFYFFGGVVEAIFGQIFGYASSIIYVVFYLSAIIISDLPSALKNRHRPGYNSLGASGGVSAMVFSSILFMPLNKICLFAVLCMPGFILGILYIIYSVTQSKNLADNINHEAHLYGALYGIVFSLIIYPEAGMMFIRQIQNYSIF